MVAGDRAMDAITNLHFQWINPSIMAVKPTYFAAVAQLPHELLWVRACLIMAQYLCEENGYVKVGRLIVCNAVSAARVKKLAGDSKMNEWLLQAETFVAACLAKYSKVALNIDVSEASVLGAQGNLLARVGAVIATASNDKDVLLSKCVLAEMKYRKFLLQHCPGAALPRPVLDKVIDDEPKKQAFRKYS